MIDDGDEILRLCNDLRDNLPSRDTMLVVISVACQGNAVDVLAKTKTLLLTVIQYVANHPFDDDLEPAHFLIDRLFWTEALPGWFLEATPFKEEVQVFSSTQEIWTVKAWLYWFLSPHEDRQWRWWSAPLVSSSLIEINIQINEIPFQWGSLRWALTAAGAHLVELSNWHVPK